MPFDILAWAITPAFAAAGLALMSIPIIIHILNRRRFKVVKWAAMEYLLQAMRKNRRRVKFEQMILLATRCLLLALLGLALARPFGCADSTIAALAGQKAALHVFVIDNSYSMGHESEQAGKTHLDVAKALAKQQIEKLAGGSESVAIVLAGRPARSEAPSTRPSGDTGVGRELVLMEPNYDVNGAIEAVNRIEQSYYSTDIVGALQAAIQIARDDKKQPQKLLYILSDCTRSGWDTPQSAEMFKQVGQQLKSTFGRNVRLNNLGRADQWNYAVLSVRPDGGLVTPTFHTDFLADIKGFGLGGDTLVQWKWDDKLLPDTTRLKPDLNTEVQRQTKVAIDQGGPHVLTVSLINDGERLKVDNTRHRVVEVASAMKVLIVEGVRGQGALSGSGAYLDLNLAPKKELDPTGKIRSSTYVVPEVIPDLELNNKVLADYSAVILTSVASLTPSQADQMEKFVRQGGTLMLFMGEQVSTDAYNTILLPRKLVPGKLITRKTVPADGKAYTFDFNPNGALHPMLSIFRGEEKTGLDTAQVFSYVQVELSPDVKPEVVLRYVPTPDGQSDAAITLHNLDRGKVVYFSTTANSEWNALPQKPSYIPLIHEMLANAVDVGDRWMNLTVGQQVQVPPTLKLSGNPVLTDPLKKQIPIDPVSADGQGTTYRSRAVDRPGLYALNIGNRTIPIAVNPPDDEADIRVLPSATIVKNLGDIDMQVFTDKTPAEALARDDSSDFGWTLMLLVLALLGVECFMAMRFGHYRKAGPSVAPATPAPTK